MSRKSQEILILLSFNAFQVSKITKFVLFGTFDTKSCKLSFIITLMVEEKAKCGFLDGHICRNYYNL